MFQNLDLAKITACVANRWAPQIGDPNVAGWLTVLAYLACAVLGHLVLRKRRDLSARARRFWLLLTGVMLFLAVNKQLDLQSALTATGRCIAHAQHWYDERRVFQRHFIEGLVLLVCALMVFGLYLLRADLRKNGLALLGLAVVGGFVAVRAVGFHHFDTLINKSLFTLRVNVVFELTGLVLIAINAFALLLAHPRQGA